MRLNTFSNLLLGIIVYFGFSSLRAQTCGTCTFIISDYNNSSYTISTGQLLCLDSSAVFEGTITLSGGTICNKGAFTPAIFVATSGTLNNYSAVGIESSFTLTNDLALINTTESITTVNGDLIINGGSINNSGIVNIKNNITFNSGTFINSAIVNCKLLSGTNLANINDTGIINKD